MTDPIQQIEERYGKGKPSVGLPQIFTDIQNLLKLVKRYEQEIIEWSDGQRNERSSREDINEIKKEIFEGA